MTNLVPIRTVAAVDSEIAELESSISGLGAAVDDVDSRINSDEYDGGSFTAASARAAAARNAVHNGSALLAAKARRRELASERVEMRRRLRDLRAERRLWTDRTPLGMVEIAAMLGYSDVAARQWKRRNVLPTPAGTVSGTPYWWRSDVLTWALARGRTRAIVDLEIDPSDWDSDDSLVEAAW